MNTQPNSTPIRPEDVLADGVDRTEINGVDVRKGTVAAFLQNATAWSNAATSAAERDALSHEIARSVPALRALNVFEVFAVRDDNLQALIDRS